MYIDAPTGEIPPDFREACDRARLLFVFHTVMSHSDYIGEIRHREPSRSRDSFIVYPGVIACRGECRECVRQRFGANR